MSLLELVDKLKNEETQRFKSNVMIEINRSILKSSQKVDAILAGHQEQAKIMNQVLPGLRKIVPGEDIVTIRDNLRLKLQELEDKKQKAEDMLLQKEIEYKKTSGQVRELKAKLHDIEDQKEELEHEINVGDLPVTLRLMKSKRDKNYQ